jgi:hypothetical protein
MIDNSIGRAAPNGVEARDRQEPLNDRGPLVVDQRAVADRQDIEIAVGTQAARNGRRVRGERCVAEHVPDDVGGRCDLIARPRFVGERRCHCDEERNAWRGSLCFALHGRFTTLCRVLVRYCE